MIELSLFGAIVAVIFYSLGRVHGFERGRAHELGLHHPRRYGPPPPPDIHDQSWLVCRCGRHADVNRIHRYEAADHRRDGA